MRVVFADAGYWVALLDPRGNLHQRAVNTSKGLGKIRIVKTEMVLSELLAALSRQAVRLIAVRGVDSIRQNPNVEVVPHTSLQFEGAYARYRSHADKEWSLMDCASFELMAMRGPFEALARDVHFEQAGFVALLRSAGAAQ